MWSLLLTNFNLHLDGIGSSEDDGLLLLELPSCLSHVWRDEWAQANKPCPLGCKKEKKKKEKKASLVALVSFLQASKLDKG